MIEGGAPDHVEQAMVERQARGRASSDINRPGAAGGAFQCFGRSFMPRLLLWITRS